MAVEGVSDFIFTNSLGKPYATNAINFALDNIVKAYNKLEETQAEKVQNRAFCIWIYHKKAYFISILEIVYTILALTS